MYLKKLSTLVRIAFYSKDARDIISENNGVAAAVACMRLAGGNKDIHHYGAFLIGQLCADNKGNQEACFEEDACEVIVNCLSDILVIGTCNYTHCGLLLP